MPNFHHPGQLKSKVALLTNQPTTALLLVKLESIKLKFQFLLIFMVFKLAPHLMGILFHGSIMLEIGE